jgi:hypothetical protein
VVIDYKRAVGPPEHYDINAAQQFCVMSKLGLRAHHKLLDIGCGSLRGGRLFIPYLDPGNYHGLEPNIDLIRLGIENELGTSILALKMPQFWYFDDFGLEKITEIGRGFDYVLAQSILSHTGKRLLTRIFQQVAAALIPGGTFAATFYKSKRDSKKAGWLGHDSAGYRWETIEQIAKKTGFSFTILPHKHPNGQTWFASRKVKK